MHIHTANISTIKITDFTKDPDPSLVWDSFRKQNYKIIYFLLHKILSEKQSKYSEENEHSK